MNSPATESTIASSNTNTSPLVKAATTAIGVALLLNDRRKKKSQKLIESSQKTSAELIEKGSEVDQKLRASTNQVIEDTQAKIEQGLEHTKDSLKKAQNSVEKAADVSRDKLLAISGVATHKDVKDNAKISHLSALSTQMAVFGENVDYQFNKQMNELTQKADKHDLAPLARSTELESLAKIEDLKSLATLEALKPLATSEELTPLAKTTDLDALAKSSELMDLATKSDLELLQQIPLLTEKVDTLATQDDLSPLAKEKSLKAVQKVLQNQMETHQSKIEVLMSQLATRDDVSELGHTQATKQDIDNATTLLASKEDVESVVKQLIKHIHHLERQVAMLKDNLPKDQPALKDAQKAKPATTKSVAESIDSVQVRAH